MVDQNPSLKLFIDHPCLPHTFSLAYHHKENQSLLEAYMKLMAKLARPLISAARQQDLPPKPSREADPTSQGRIRIGFLSEFFYTHSNTLAFEGLIRHLDRCLFDVILIHQPQSRDDETRRELDSCCQEVVHLTSNFFDTIPRLLNLQLDILFFTDLGTSPYDFLTPFARVAPIQMTGWGVPHTSGIEAIDYYISSDSLEGPESDKLYTESLIRLPGGLPCCFLTEKLQLHPLPREYFMLPSEGKLVGCLQSLHKLHPDFDHLMESIAVENPDAIFVFVEDPIAARTQRFLERLSSHAPTVHEHCLLLSPMSREEYHALTHCLDLLLDPVYYGMGITFFESSFVGTPVVTMEGQALRSRVTTCGYREMGLEDPPIASSENAYVQLATALLHDPQRLERLRASILERNHLIFDRIDHVRNFETFCATLVEKKRL